MSKQLIIVEVRISRNFKLGVFELSITDLHGL